MTPVEANAHDLEQELAWLAQVINARFSLYFENESDVTDVTDVVPPDVLESTSPFARFLVHHEATFIERLAIILALASHIRPQLLDVFFTKNQIFDRPFSEFGGVYGRNDITFLPTGETLMFLVAGREISRRFAVLRLFDGTHYFTQHSILERNDAVGTSVQNAILSLSAEYFYSFTTGQQRHPAFGVNFPARLIETELTFDDLVLHPNSLTQIKELQTWLRHGKTLMEDWKMAAKLRPGYRALFYGPPGTGKTITACILGKEFEREVYKVDLSMVVSKYIGETEKNLGKVFDQAESKGWILFFDEADALFGKRSETKDAHDRFANQEVAFLLQRIESFDGIVILASNQRGNIDDAFTRRFESIIYFPMPKAPERLRLWQQGFSPMADLSRLDLQAIANQHELTGGTIMNVIRYSSLLTLQADTTIIAPEIILQGVRREYAKEGKK